MRFTSKRASETIKLLTAYSLFPPKVWLELRAHNVAATPNFNSILFGQECVSLGGRLLNLNFNGEKLNVRVRVPQ